MHRPKWFPTLGSDGTGGAIRLRMPRIPGWPREQIVATAADFEYLPTRGGMRSYNRVAPLRAGAETFPAMLAAIELASSEILLESYILRADHIGERFKTALVKRAQAGVTVRVLFDSLGSFGLSSAFIDDLRKAGIEVVEYSPIAPWRPRWGVNRRDHQKLVVVDRKIGFTGGINIGDEYVPADQGGGGWHDMHVQIEGPAAIDLARLFHRTWEKAGGTPFVKPRGVRSLEPSEEYPTFVQVISNHGMITRSRMRHAYLRAIRRAEERIDIMNAYFIPDRGLRRAFYEAVRRGVQVRVIVPSESDVQAVYYASRHLYSRLMRGGVRIFEWPERMMHAKVAMIDGVWSTIGSFNIDRRSFLHNLECGVIFVDRIHSRRLRDDFDRDIGGCHEIQATEWEKRPMWEKLFESFFFQLRYWL